MIIETPGIRKEIDQYINHFKRDPVVKAWLTEALKKPDKYKDRDLIFYAVVAKVIEDFAKLAVLTNFQKTTKIVNCLNNLNEQENTIAIIAAESLKKEILNAREAKK